MNKINVFIADDHEIVRRGIVESLNKSGVYQIIGEAETVKDTIRHPKLQEASVLVLDLNFPDGDGVRVVEYCQRNFSHLGIVIFTMQKEDGYALSLLQAGAKGFLSKERDIDELKLAIDTVAAGKTYMTEQLNIARQNRGEAAKYTQPHEGLSDRERQIFERLIRGSSVGEISDTLCLGSSTVSTYVQRIRQKLGVETNFEVIQYAFRKRLIQ